MKNKKELMGRIIKILIIVVLNTPLIVMLIMNMVPLNIEVLINGERQIIELSYGDCITSKSTYMMLEDLMIGMGGKFELISNYLPEYHWGNKFIFYLAQIGCWFIMFWYIKIIYFKYREEIRYKREQKTLEQREALQEQKILSKLTKKEDKEIERIIKS